MKIQPEYLWQSRTGTFFFRARVPKQFVGHFKTNEIKRSLKTDSQRLATKLARAYRVELDKEMDKLTSGVYSPYTVTLEGKIPITCLMEQKRP